MSEESEEEFFNDDTLKENIASCLDNIQCIGSFAMFEPLHSMPNPGLFIQDVGIGLPLSHVDAATIMTASHQAPFGRGTETVVDESIRNTRELSSNEFRLANPEWNKALGNILRKISDGLGLTASGKSMEAQIYKLLLYEEGAHFKPHQDSEKAPGMFGTLVIALPSQHQGGEVHLSHKSQKKIFETSKFADFSYSYLAWFSDVIHEVKPVKSGRRLVLTYNLVQTSPGKKETAANSTKDLTKLNCIFSWWQKHKSDEGTYLPKVMAHLFEHFYTEAGLCYGALKGKDLQVAAHLKEAAAENDFHICLANFKRTISGDAEDGYPHESHYWDDDEDDDEEGKHHSIEYEHERETSLVYIAELDGTSLIARNITFDEDNIVQEDPFEDVLPDDEEFEGHTGNAGAQATHHYNRTVALIMPRSHRIPYFLKYIKPDEWLDLLASDTANRPESAEGNARDMLEICNLVVNESKEWEITAEAYSSRPYSDKILARILKAAVDFDDKGLFLETYELVYGKVPMGMLASLGFAVARHDLLELLLPHLTLEFSRFDMCSDRYLAICKFNDGINTGLNSSNPPAAIPYKAGPLYNWIRSQCWECLNSARVESAMDGLNISSLCMMFPDRIMDVILPKMKENIPSTQATVAFLVNLFDLGELGRVSKDVTTGVFTGMISIMIEHFSVNRVDTDIVSNKRLRASGGSSHPVSVAPAEFGKRNLAQLLYCCLSLKLESELLQLIQRLCEIAAKVDVRCLDTIFLPFLKDMIDMLRENQVTIAGSPIRSLFQKILDTYIRRFVRPEPRETDWSMKERGCNGRFCDDCEKLDEFLSSPTQRVERFRVSKAARHHLHVRLNGGSCKHETDRRTNTLIVTKPAISGSHEAWKKRYDHAVEKIQALGSDLLEDLLEECYEFVVSLSAVKRTPISIPNRQRPMMPSIPRSEQPPPPPAWLKAFLEVLKIKFPDESFEAVMKHRIVDVNSGAVIPSLSSGQPTPPNAKWVYLPHIRCLRCPEKLYDLGFSTTSDNNFEVQLKNIEAHLKRHGDQATSKSTTERGHAPPSAFSQTFTSGGNSVPISNAVGKNWDIGRVNCLAGKNFFLANASALPTLSRAQLIAILEKYGGKWGESPTIRKEVSTIIVPTNLISKSIELGYKAAIDEDGLYALIATSSANGESSASGSPATSAINNAPSLKAGGKNWNIGAPNCLAGMTFHFPATLLTLTQEDSRAIVEKYGGKVGWPEQATTIMVLARNAHPLSAKNWTNKGHQVIDEDGLYALIIKSPANGANSISGSSSAPPAKAEAKKWDIGAPNCLAGMTFGFRDNLPALSLKQSYAVVEKYGGKIGYNKNTTIFMANTNPSELKVAKQIGYQSIIDAEGFYALIASSRTGESSTSGSSAMGTIPPLSTLAENLMNRVLPPPTRRKTPSGTVPYDETEYYTPTTATAPALPPRRSPRKMGMSTMIDITEDSD